MAFTLLVVLLQGFLFSVGGAKKAQEKFQGWKCDDMTPNLCDTLQVIEGNFETRSSLMIHYWRYVPPTPIDSFPVVVINGGPGYPHNYDLPLHQLACRRRREVIFYDQGGTGLSALPNNTNVAEEYPFLLDVSYYGEEELPALVKALDLDQYHVVADSWGTMIALQYAVHHDDPNLVSLSLNGPIPKVTDLIDKAWDPKVGSIGTLPSYIKDRMYAIQASGDFESQEMQEINQVVFTEFYSRNGLIADCVVDSIMNINEEVEVGMWGAVDFFNITGTLKTFDLTPFLRDMLSNMPTLITCGEFDLIRPVTVNAMHQAMPLSETKIFAGSGHLSLFDATGELLDTVDDFLVRVEESIATNIKFKPRQSMENKRTWTRPAALNYLVMAVLVVFAFALGIWVGKRGQKGKYTAIV
jgi:proline iminopeptidase